MADQTEGYITVADFIKIYAISRSAFYRAVKSRGLRMTKIGRASRIARAEADRWAAALPTVGREASV